MTSRRHPGPEVGEPAGSGTWFSRRVAVALPFVPRAIRRERTAAEPVLGASVLSRSGGDGRFDDRPTRWRRHQRLVRERYGLCRRGAWVARLGNREDRRTVRGRPRGHSPDHERRAERDGLYRRPPRSGGQGDRARDGQPVDGPPHPIFVRLARRHDGDQIRLQGPPALRPVPRDATRVHRAKPLRCGSQASVRQDQPINRSP